MQPFHARGFSLTELLIILCLVAIVSSLALPNLNQYVQNNRHDNLRHSLQSHLKTTRSEAISLMRRVELCGSSTGQQCDHAWNQGWLIRDVATGATLAYTRQAEPAIGTGRLRWAGTGASSQTILYQANGTTAASNGRFILCAGDDTVVWQLVINRQGRVRHNSGLEAGQNDGALCR